MAVHLDDVMRYMRPCDQERTLTGIFDQVHANVQEQRMDRACDQWINEEIVEHVWVNEENILPREEEEIDDYYLERERRFNAVQRAIRGNKKPKFDINIDDILKEI